MADGGPAVDQAARMAKVRAKLVEVGWPALYKDVTPLQYLDVGWGSRETDQVAMFGNELELPKCTGKPNVWWQVAPDVRYCIVAFDADATEAAPAAAEVTSPSPFAAPTGQPSPPLYLHWLRFNVTGDLQYSTGRDVVRWQAPHPPEGAAPRRFFVACFEQTAGDVDVAKLPLVATTSTQHRRGFSLVRLAVDHKLRFLGANCVRFGFHAAVVPKLVASLRDEVVLDPTGRRVVAEVHNGVRREFATEAPKAL